MGRNDSGKKVGQGMEREKHRLERKKPAGRGQPVVRNSPREQRKTGTGISGNSRSILVEQQVNHTVDYSTIDRHCTIGRDEVHEEARGGWYPGRVSDREALSATDVYDHWDLGKE